MVSQPAIMFAHPSEVCLYLQQSRLPATLLFLLGDCKISTKSIPLALIQAVCVAGLLASKDSMTPAKIIVASAGANLVGDLALCRSTGPFALVRPVGCLIGRGANPLSAIEGAAYATTLSLLLGASLMLRAVHRAGLLPRGKNARFTASLRAVAQTPPSPDTSHALWSYAAPLFVIVATRVAGMVSQASTAAALGPAAMAAHQVFPDEICLHHP